MFLHIVDVGHSFVDNDALPGRQQRSAHSHRVDGPRRSPFCSCCSARSSAVRATRCNNAVQQATTNEPSEPLAELGVAPGASDRPTNNSTASEEMTRARVRALAACRRWRLLRGRAAWPLSRRASLRFRPGRRARRPTLLLLTSLPLLFGEDFSLEGSGSPALKALQPATAWCRSASPIRRELAKGRLLLMAQPQAQTAENLVALDAWVRGGGRLLLLADPMLEWPSKRPLGDRTRPPPMFMDTGLLAHWGLRLDAPDERGPQRPRLGGLRRSDRFTGPLHGNCPISARPAGGPLPLGQGQRRR